MRREGYIIEEIVDYSNMAESFDTVLRGSKRKRCRQGRWLLAHRDEVIRELAERIRSTGDMALLDGITALARQIEER